MDHEIEREFLELKDTLERKFGEGLDVQAILFLIGVNELGVGYRDFTKDQKTDLMHIAICTILEPYGYYKFVELDDENWPHFENTKPLPKLDSRQQQHLIKEALIEYFKANAYFSPNP